MIYNFRVTFNVRLDTDRQTTYEVLPDKVDEEYVADQVQDALCEIDHAAIRLGKIKVKRITPPAI